MALPLLKIFNQTNSSQIEFVRAGLRPACRISASPSELKRLMVSLDEVSLKACVGYEAIVRKAVPGRAMYSEWSSRLPSEQFPHADRYLYVAPTRMRAERVRRADESRMDAEFGELLGYPNCCVAKFCTADWSGEIDPVLATYANHDTIAWPMNVSLLSFDQTLLAHVPCSERCQKSLQLAFAFHSHLQEIDPPLADQLQSTLQTYVLHSNKLGVAALDCRLENGQLALSHVRLCHSESVLAGILEGAKAILLEAGFVQIERIGIATKEIKLFNFV